MRRPYLLAVCLLAGPALAGEPGPSAPETPVAAASPAPDPAPPPPAAPAAELVPPAPRAAPPPAVAEEPTDAPETGPQAKRIDDQSAELEAIRAAEQATRVLEAPSAEARAAEAAEALGAGSPLRERLEGALSRPLASPSAEERGHIALLPELDHGEDQLRVEYDIPVEVNESVVSFVRFFQSPLVRPHFVKWLGRSHRYLEHYRAILREEGLPEDTVFLAMIESGFANFAQSRARAVGPWQFIASTGKLFGLKQDFWVDERRDPEKSARAAARYLKELRQQTGDWRLAWAGYNAGAGVILHAQSKGYQDFWSMAASKGRRIMRAETKGYVPKLMAAAIIAKHPEAFGFSAEEIEPERWPDYVEADIPGATLLGVVARAAGVDERTVVDLNPELRRACTPPRPYRIKLPREAAETFAARWPELAPAARASFDGHVVKRGESLAAIAAQYGVPVQGIEELNPGVSARKLRPGTELVIPRGGSSPRVASAPPRPAAPPAALEPARPAVALPPPASKAAAPVAVAAASPPPGEPAAAPEHRDSWRVQRGDTLWSIAQQVGMELKELCRLNGIVNPRTHRLQIGAVLKLVARG